MSFGSRRWAVVGTGIALTAGVLIAPGASPVAAIAAPQGAKPADSFTPRDTQRDAGLDLLIRRSVALDTRAEDPLVTFIAGLPRDGAGLQARATKASNPEEIEYRDFMTLNEAGAAFGATSKAIKKVRAAAKRAEVSVKIDPSRVIARFTAPASTWNSLYGSKLRVTAPTTFSPYRSFMMVKDGKTARAPAAFKQVTAEWMATYAEYVASADMAGIDPGQVQGLQGLLDSPGSPLAWPSNAGTMPTDNCGQQALRQKSVYAPAQVRKAYGTTALASRNMRGVGARLTIMSLGGGFDEADIAAAASCFGYAQPRIDVVRGTGVSADFVNDSVESHLDIMTASSVISRAESIQLLEVVNPEIGFTDGFARMLNYDGKGTVSPDAVSISYVTCEPTYAEDFASYIPLNEDLLAMAALVGTTVVAAAGDNGTSACGENASLELDMPLVAYPASSPWITAVGGTRLTLNAANQRASEVVWNDQAFTDGGLDAGAGGPSLVFDRPWYQQGVTPVGPRTLPDVAVLGAVRPGWPVYYGGSLYSVGGTSGGTPFLAANLAAIAAGQRATGYPSLGFVNPWLYEAAADPKSPFHDITSGSNALQQVGCCVAYAGYDMASGLGAPDMYALFRTLPYPAG